MKKRKNIGAKIVAFISLLALVVGTFSVGISFFLQTKENERAQKELLKKYDTNWDGQISADEIKALMPKDVELEAKSEGVEESSENTETPAEVQPISE